MRKRKFTIIVAAAAMLVSSVVGATTLRTPDAAATDAGDVASDVAEAAQQLDTIAATDLDVMNVPVADATNETLILVVAARAPTVDEAQSRLDEVNARFGRLQGFYLDEARHYDVVGLLTQTSPETVAVPCTTAEDGHSDLDCPDGVDAVSELQSTTLQLVDEAGLSSLTLPSCADVALAPCHEEYLEVLPSDLDFVPSDWLLLTGFRTKRGAEEFLDLARAVGVGGLVVVQATKLGGGDIGLGQEPHPDGSGPLLGPLDDQQAYQR